LFFLRNLRITGVISLSIPISIIGTFALIYFGGFTLNLMTLGGLALGVGMMVDSSIVVLENIFRRRDEEHEVPALAASRGAREVGPAIIASTITTLVIFIPVIFVRGVTGLLFQDLAYVIVFSLVCSLLVALSLVPMLAARMILPREVARKRRGGWAQRLSERAGRSFEKMDTGYRRLLDRALRHRLKVVGGATALLGASFLLVPLIGSEFLPPSDEGEVGIYARMEIGTRAEIVDEAMRRVEAIVEEMVPERRADVVSIYEGRADIRLSLVPARERSRSNIEIADELRERLRGAIPGMEVFVSAPQGQFLLNRILDTNSGNGFDIEVRGRELDTLRALSEEVVETIRDIEGIVEVDASMESGLPQEELRIDRAKVAALGLSARDVTAALRTAVAGSDAGNFQEAGRSYEIMVQLADAESLSIDQVLDLVLSTPSGELVALRNLVETSSSRAPQEIERKDQQRYAEVDVSVSGRDIGSVAQEVQARLASIPRPAGYSFILTGSFEEQQEAFNELLFALVLALLLVYMVLACQYESLLNPLIVMISTPMAAIGVFITLAATGTTFNLQSAIGCIMLGGIVVNNAILLVDQANRLEQEGWALDAAVAEAGRRRLRPILMTTATTILGLTPLALGFGEGADAQAPLARAVVGGLIGSTALTLILIPAVYSLAHSALGQRRAEELEATSAAAAR
ncbi:MAG: efflux RND transporter permease subunit, partial [Opitutales bacterium]